MSKVAERAAIQLLIAVFDELPQSTQASHESKYKLAKEYAEKYSHIIAQSYKSLEQDLKHSIELIAYWGNSGALQLDAEERIFIRRVSKDLKRKPTTALSCCSGRKG